MIGWRSALLALLACSPAAAEDALSVTGSVTLDAAMVQRGDIAFTAVRNVRQTVEVAGFGTVIEPAKLAETATALAEAAAQLDVAHAKLAASTGGYQRGQRLFAAEQNISKAELQAAEVMFRTDQAASITAEAQLSAASIAARQAWGSLLATAIEKHEEPAARLLSGRQVLIQATATLGADAAPNGGFVEGGQVPLTYLSPVAHVDPRLPGNSYFFTAPADPGLTPGAAIGVRLETGVELTAAFVPETALVRWQGADWIYQARGEHTVTRQRIATDQPARSGTGYLVAGLADGARIVTRGTQLVLSEEFKALARAGDND